MWLVETVQSRHQCQRTYTGIVSMQTITYRTPTFGKNKEWKVVWLYSVRHGSFEEVETSFCKLSPSIEKHSGRSERFWQVVEAVCTRRWLDVLASKIANLRLQVTKQNAHYSSTVVFSAIGACCYKNTPFCWVHTKGMLQQFCAVSSGRKKARWREPKVHCSRWDNETTSEQFLWLPIMDRSRHTVTKYLNEEKTHCAVNSEFFQKLDHLNHQLYEVKLAKPEIEHKEPFVVRFFVLQYEKLRMLELYYNFFDKFLTSTSSKSWKWILSTLLWLNKNWLIVFDQR